MGARSFNGVLRRLAQLTGRMQNLLARQVLLLHSLVQVT